MASFARVHRRLWWLLPLLLVAAPRAAVSQDRITLEITLAADSAPSGSRDPILRARDLVSDDRWSSMLRSGFPVRMHFQVELWRDRDVWFDAFERQVEWDIIVRREPLLDQYTVNTITPASVSERRYATLGALTNALEYAYRITIGPTEPGDYYYAGVLGLATLSDTDLEEIDRFLRGDLGSAATGGENLGDAVSRGAKRLLLRLAGLPSLRLEARSDRFKVR